MCWKELLSHSHTGYSFLALKKCMHIDLEGQKRKPFVSAQFSRQRKQGCSTDLICLFDKIWLESRLRNATPALGGNYAVYFIENKVTDRTLPCGTPISLSVVNRIVRSYADLNWRFLRKLFRKQGRRPRKLKLCWSFRILYLYEVSYALSKLKKVWNDTFLFSEGVFDITIEASKVVHWVLMITDIGG